MLNNDNSNHLENELEIIDKEIPSIIPQRSGTGFYSIVNNTENFLSSYICNVCKEFPIIFFLMTIILK